MTEQPHNDAGGATGTIVEDLFVTPSFLIKGRLANKTRRLSEALQDHGRAYLKIVDVAMVSLRGQEVIQAPSVLVHTDEVLFAHELLDVGSDAELKRLAGEKELVRVRAFYGGQAQLELGGSIERGAYEPSYNDRHYFVMHDPQLRGIDFAKNAELAVLKKLSYAIVRKERMAYLYDFG